VPSIFGRPVPASCQRVEHRTGESTECQNFSGPFDKPVENGRTRQAGRTMTNRCAPGKQVQDGENHSVDFCMSTVDRSEVPMSVRPIPARGRGTKGFLNKDAFYGE
jgi:hypothetical protein